MAPLTEQQEKEARDARAAKAKQVLELNADAQSYLIQFLEPVMLALFNSKENYGGKQVAVSGPKAFEPDAPNPKPTPGDTGTRPTITKKPIDAISKTSESNRRADPNLNTKRFNYQHVTALTYDDDATALNKLFRMKGASFWTDDFPFNELVRMFMRPNIQLFKVYHRDQAGAGDKFIVEIPLGDVDTKNTKVVSQREGTQFEQILRQTGIYSKVGIQDVSIKMLGKDEATADSILETSMTLVFPSVDTFVTNFEVIDPDTQDSFVFTYADMIRQVSRFSPRDKIAGQTKQVTSADGKTINSIAEAPVNWDNVCAPRPPTPTQVQENNPFYFTIMAQIGYVFDQNGAKNAGISPDDIKTIQSAIIHNKYTMFLQLKGYEVGVNKSDGKMTVKLEYITPLETMLSSLHANLFNVFNLENRAQALEFEAAENQAKTAVTAAGKAQAAKAAADPQAAWRRPAEKRTTPKTPSGSAPAVAAPAKESDSPEADKLRIATQRKETFRRKVANEFYLSFFKKLYGESRVYQARFTYTQREGETKSFAIEVELEDGAEKSWDFKYTEKVKQVHFKDAGVLEFPTSENEIIDGWLEYLNWFTSDVVKDIGTGDEAQNVADNLHKMINRTGGTFSRGADGMDVNFTTVGDILDVAVGLTEGGGAYLENQKVRVLLGPMSGLLSLTSTEENGRRNLSSIMTSLAEFPVSIGALQAFWVQHVIAPGRRTEYTLQEFIDDLFDTFLHNLINSAFRNLLGGLSLARIKLDVIFFNAAEKIEPGYYDITRLPTGPEAPNKLDLININNSSNYWSYYVLRISNPSPNYLDPSLEAEAKNAANGVYTLRYGEANSLVKEMSFARDKAPGLREARILEEGDDAAGFMQEKYDATIKMFGNALFRPGMYIKIDPRGEVTGIKNPHFLSRVLGIGGFYVVHSVDHTLFSGGDPTFETEIKVIREYDGCNEKEKAQIISSAESEFIAPTKDSDAWFDKNYKALGRKLEAGYDNALEAARASERYNQILKERTPPGSEPVGGIRVGDILTDKELVVDGS